MRRSNQIEDGWILGVGLHDPEGPWRRSAGEQRLSDAGPRRSVPEQTGIVLGFSGAALFSSGFWQQQAHKRY